LAACDTMAKRGLLYYTSSVTCHDRLSQVYCTTGRYFTAAGTPLTPSTLHRIDTAWAKSMTEGGLLTIPPSSLDFVASIGRFRGSGFQLTLEHVTLTQCPFSGPSLPVSPNAIYPCGDLNSLLKRITWLTTQSLSLSEVHESDNWDPRHSVLLVSDIERAPFV
jgi:hypothetical protein